MFGFNSLEIIDSSSLRAEKGKLLFDFTCPRCGHDQTASMDEKEIVDGKTFHCTNTAICGEQRNMHMTVNGLTRVALNLRVEDIGIDDIDWGHGANQDRNDAPLNDA